MFTPNPRFTNAKSMYVDRWGSVSSLVKVQIIYQNGGGGGGNFTGNINANQILDASASGLTVITGTAIQARSALGLGTAATTDATAYATAAQGNLAANAVQPAVLNTRTDAMNSASSNSLANKADLVSGVVPVAQIPAIAIVSFLGTSANQAAMLAKSGQQGDWTIRLDSNTTWVITGSDPTQLANWTQLGYPTIPVQSVAGKTGIVTLVPADAGADPAGAANTVYGALNTAVGNISTLQNTVANQGSNITALQNSVANTINGTQLNTALANYVQGGANANNPYLLHVLLPGDPINAAAGSNALLNVAQANYNAGIVLANSGGNTNVFSNGMSMYVFSSNVGAGSFQSAGFTWYDDGDTSAGIVFQQNNALQTGYMVMGVPYASTVQTADLPANTFIPGQKFAAALVMNYAANTGSLRANGHTANIGAPASYNGQPKYPIYGSGGSTWTRTWIFAGVHNQATQDLVLAQILSGSTVIVKDAVLLGSDGYVPNAFINQAPTTNAINAAALARPFVEVGFAGNLTTGLLGTVPTFFKDNGTLAHVSAVVGGAPTGSDIIIDVLVNGSSVFTNINNRPHIVAGNMSTDLDLTSLNIAYTALTRITFSLPQVGSNVPGNNLGIRMEKSP